MRAETATSGEIVVLVAARAGLYRSAPLLLAPVGAAGLVTDDADLAEALQRIPGVTIERNKGLGGRVSVRGLPSEFTFVTINGLATASGSGGRDVEFDIFASEIIQQVTVQKSPRAADERVTASRSRSTVPSAFLPNVKFSPTTTSTTCRRPKSPCASSMRPRGW